MNNYGEYFKAVRESLGLTLREVEKLTNISNAHLSQLESGKIKQPSPMVLYKLSEIYKVPYGNLMELVGYPVPSDQMIPINQETEVMGRFGKISQDEEIALLEYLKFIRTRKIK